MEFTDSPKWNYIKDSETGHLLQESSSFNVALLEQWLLYIVLFFINII